jgi:hypothetical protein
MRGAVAESAVTSRSPDRSKAARGIAEARQLVAERFSRTVLSGWAYGALYPIKHRTHRSP